MVEIQWSEQYEDDSRLSNRKKLHRLYSINKVDTQYEAIRRIGTPNSVLDIGCGSGDLLTKLRLIGFKGKLKGIDKYNIVNEAAKSPEIKNLNIELEQIDIAKQTENNHWDVGVMVSILMGIPEFKDVIKRYSKICKKIIVVDVGPGAYPWLNNAFPDKIEEMFRIRLTLRGLPYNIQDVITEFTKYYETIKIQKLDDSFRFTNAETAVEYFNTHGPGAWIPKPTESKWKEILTYVKSVVQKEIEANGVWLEPKPYYVVTAENPAKTVLPYVTYSHQCNSGRLEK